MRVVPLMQLSLKRQYDHEMADPFIGCHGGGVKPGSCGSDGFCRTVGGGNKLTAAPAKSCVNI